MRETGLGRLEVQSRIRTEADGMVGCEETEAWDER